MTEVDESKVPEPPLRGFMGLSRTAWANLMLVAGFYFFAKFVRYAIWSWAAYLLQAGVRAPSSEAARSVRIRNSSSQFGAGLM